MLPPSSRRLEDPSDEQEEEETLRLCPTPQHWRQAREVGMLTFMPHTTLFLPVFTLCQLESFICCLFLGPLGPQLGGYHKAGGPLGPGQLGGYRQLGAGVSLPGQMAYRQVLVCGLPYPARSVSLVCEEVTVLQGTCMGLVRPSVNTCILFPSSAEEEETLRLCSVFLAL